MVRPTKANNKGLLSICVATPRVQLLRKRLKLSRTEFSLRFRFHLKAIEDWEAGRSAPDKAAAILLRMIEQQPDLVERVIQIGQQRF